MCGGHRLLAPFAEVSIRSAVERLIARSSPHTTTSRPSWRSTMASASLTTRPRRTSPVLPSVAERMLTAINDPVSCSKLFVNSASVFVAYSVHPRQVHPAESPFVSLLGVRCPRGCPAPLWFAAEPLSFPQRRWILGVPKERLHRHPLDCGGLSHRFSKRFDPATRRRIAMTRFEKRRLWPSHSKFHGRHNARVCR